MRFKLILTGVLLSTLAGCQTTGGTAAPTVVKSNVTGQIDVDAERALRAMCDLLRAAQTIHMVADNDYDVIDGTETITYSRRTTMDLRRPDRITGFSDGDQYKKRYWFDGQRLNILDLRANAYSVVESPGTVDNLIDTMSQKYGLMMPLTDFVFSDPYKALTDEIKQGRYIGLHKLNGVPCHHLAFVQDAVDWQIWIDAGDHPFPRKLIVNNKRVPSVPVFVAHFVEWDLGKSMPDSDFAFEPPVGAHQVEMLPVRN